MAMKRATPDEQRAMRETYPDGLPMNSMNTLISVEWMLAGLAVLWGHSWPEPREPLASMWR